MHLLPNTLSQQALTQSTRQSASEALLASKTARKILSSYPDYGKAPPEYLLSVTEFIAFRSAEEQEALAHPLSGIATKCKFLPTLADMNEFLDARAKRLNTRATGYKYFKRGEGDPLDIADAERRKTQVMETLGYDPAKPRPTKLTPLDRGIMDAIEHDRWSSADLKTPAKPASAELKALLKEQGYPQPVDAHETSQAA
jgi:hypothetical protein